mmetsp:Transcript_15153/g.22793  ORF Transcript_15153/g.22793 Transcript_15153/m.22793 type:complete len:200 (+) Transcript_15153:191-790(+)
MAPSSSSSACIARGISMTPPLAPSGSIRLVLWRRDHLLWHSSIIFRILGSVGIFLARVFRSNWRSRVMYSSICPNSSLSNGGVCAVHNALTSSSVIRSSNSSVFTVSCFFSSWLCARSLDSFPKPISSTVPGARGTIPVNGFSSSGAGGGALRLISSSCARIVFSRAEMPKKSSMYLDFSILGILVMMVAIYSSMSFVL